MIADLSLYFWGLWGYARWFLAGGPFFVDTIIKRIFPEFASKIDRVVKPQTRVRIELLLLFLAMFVAGFLAWKDEHLGRIAAEGSPSRAGRHLTSGQQERLKTRLRADGDQKYSIQINSVPNCDECEDYAQEFRDVFNELNGWKADGGVLSFSGYPYRYGLGFSVNSTYPKGLNSIITSAFDAAGIAIRSEDAADYGRETAAVIVVARQNK
jgi:hypothetical protein